MKPIRIVLHLSSLAACCAFAAFFYYWSASHLFLGANVGLICLSSTSFAFLKIRSNKLRNTQEWLSIGLLALAGVLFIASTTYVVTSLANINYEDCQNLLTDGAQVVKIWLFKNGINIYPKNDKYQCIVSIYTPGYYLLSAAVDFILNNTYLSALVVNGLSLLVICSVMALWIYRESRTAATGALAVIGYLSSPVMINSVAHVRSDLLAWAFALSGAYLFFNKKQGSKWRYAAAALLGSSVFIKQQVAAILIGCVSACIISWSSWRKCLALLFLSGVICTALFSVVQYYTEGGFLTHVLLYPFAMAKNSLVSTWSNAEQRVIHFAATNIVILTITFAIILHDVIRKRFHPLDWMIIIHIPFVIRLLMHWGASDNYFWGITALMYTRVGCYLGEVSAQNTQWPLQTAPLLLLLFATTPSHSYLIQQLDFRKIQNETVARLPGIIETAGYHNVLINSEAGSTVLRLADRVQFTFFDGFDLSFFEQSKLWKGNQSQLYMDIRDRKYDAVVVGSSFVAPSFYWNLYDSYTVSANIGSTKICTPLQGRLIKYPVPTDKAVMQGGLTLTLADIIETYVSASYNAFSLTKHESSQTATFIFKLESTTVMHSIRVALVPLVKHIGDGNMITAEWSTDKASFHPVYMHTGSPDDNKKGFIDARSEFTFFPDSHVVYLKFILHGSGQLWFNQDYPISFLVN